MPAGSVTFTPVNQDSMDELIEDYTDGLSLLPGLSASPDAVVFKIFYPLFFKFA